MMSVNYGDYTMTYDKNPVTQRMNQLFMCNHEGCGKVFRKVCSLREHIKIHSNDKPFVCFDCGRGFS